MRTGKRDSNLLYFMGQGTFEPDECTSIFGVTEKWQVPTQTGTE